MAYIVMAFIVMGYIVLAYIVMAYIVMAYMVMAYIVMAYFVMGGGMVDWSAPQLARQSAAWGRCQDRSRGRSGRPR